MHNTNAYGSGSVRGDLAALRGIWETHLPNGREKSLALTKLDEAMLWAVESLED